MRYLKDKVILTDCDGVLLDWEYAFDFWMQERGYTIKDDTPYKQSERYGISPEKCDELISYFNSSAAIAFIPPHRDAVHYVRKLYEEHGYIFRCISSLSTDKNAQKLRDINLNKIFGKDIFYDNIYLSTGADKDKVLAQFKGSECYWIEDKPENGHVGQDVAGLDPIIMAHDHNSDTTLPRFNNWKEIYNHIVGN